MDIAAPVLLPRVLLTNDDGIDAPGLAVLEEVALQFAQEVWVLAPESDRSGVAMSVSLNEPVRCIPRGTRRWAVRGTPADCVALALSHFMADARPSLVLSGVNAAENIGDELSLSGTVGAALTALMLGVPAIAISQERVSRETTPWETTRAVLPNVLKPLLAQGWRKETCLSINIPKLPPEQITGVSWTRSSQKTIAALKTERRLSPRGAEYFWLSIGRQPPQETANSDSATLKRGEVTVTALALDRSVDLGRSSFSFAETERSASDLLALDDE